MTDRTERRLSIAGIVLAALLAAGSVGAFLVRPVAQAEVRPVAEKVETLDRRTTRLETQQENSDRRLQEMRDDIKEILKAVK